MPPSPSIRLLVLEERPLLKAGVIASLERESDIVVLVEDANLRGRLQGPPGLDGDVVLLGQTARQGLGGPIADVLANRPTARIIVMSHRVGPVHARNAIAAGASGFLHESSTAHELGRAIRNVSAGTRYVDGTTAMALARGPQVDELRPKEIEVLRHAARGKGNKQIAAALATTEGNIKNHLKRILATLDARNRTHAVVIALERGFIELDE